MRRVTAVLAVHEALAFSRDSSGRARCQREQERWTTTQKLTEPLELRVITDTARHVHFQMLGDMRLVRTKTVANFVGEAEALGNLHEDEG